MRSAPLANLSPIFLTSKTCTRGSISCRRYHREHPTAQALLSNAFAWMRKASEDSLDGMVALLQKVLQLYAGKVLSAAGTPQDGDAAESALRRLIAAEEEQWDSLLRQDAAQQARP